MATNELSSMKKDYTKNFDDLSNWIRVSEEKLSTQQSLTGRNINDNDEDISQKIIKIPMKSF